MAQLLAHQLFDAETPDERLQYSAEGWAVLIRLARVVQKIPKGTMVRALEIVEGYVSPWAQTPSRSYKISPYTYRHELSVPGELTKVMMLLRLVFDVPEAVDATIVPGVGDVKGKNLAWPMSFTGGHPGLIDLATAFGGIGYAPSREYKYWLFRYPMRNLNRLKLPKE